MLSVPATQDMLCVALVAGASLASSSGCAASRATSDEGAGDASVVRLPESASPDGLSNAERAYFELGICGPACGDSTLLSYVPNALCGLFKTPTLRNVSTLSVFFHNCVMHSLEQVQRVFDTRGRRPELWYPTVGGKPTRENEPNFPSYGLITKEYVGGKFAKLDDLPVAFLRNVDRQMPLDERKLGSTPPLSERDITDLICFLDTLTDDHQPPVSPKASGPCIN